MAARTVVATWSGVGRAADSAAVSSRLGSRTATQAVVRSAASATRAGRPRRARGTPPWLMDAGSWPGRVREHRGAVRDPCLVGDTDRLALELLADAAAHRLRGVQVH